MRIDRDVPIFRQPQRRTGMVEVPMREYDRFRSRARTKARFGRFNDLPRPPGKSGIHQHPRAARPPDEIDIHETDGQPADVGRYASNRGHVGTKKVTTVTWLQSFQGGQKAAALLPFVTL